MNQPPYQPSHHPYQQPSYGQFQAPPPPLQKPPTPWRQFRAKSRKFQWSIGCGTILGIFFLCGICGAIANALPSTAQTASGSTPTATTVHVAQAATSPVATTQAVTATPAMTPAVTPTTTPTATPTPTPKPTAKPTPKPTPKPTGVNGNPWGYNFTPGNLIYNPPASFCDYFACIASFWNGSGYVMECQDQTYSKSGGRSGSCSHHGGNYRALYSH